MTLLQSSPTSFRVTVPLGNPGPRQVHNAYTIVRHCPHGKGVIMKGKGQPIVKYRNTMPWAVQTAETAEQIEIRDAAWDLEVRIRRDVHWRHLVNTSEPSMCTGDATCCRSTLTSCCFTSLLSRVNPGWVQSHNRGNHTEQVSTGPDVLSLSQQRQSTEGWIN